MIVIYRICVVIFYGKIRDEYWNKRKEFGRRRNKTEVIVGGKRNNWGEEAKDMIIGDDEL